MPFNFHNQQTIVERVQYWAEKQPDSEAFVFIDKDGLRSVLTCKDVCDQAIYVSKHLQRLGLVPGEVVCSMLPDSPNGVIALFGIMFSGCLAMGGLLQVSDGSILIKTLNRAKCKALILSSHPENEYRIVFSKIVDHRDNHRVSSEKLPYLTHVIYSSADGSHGFQWADLNPGEELLPDERVIWNDIHSDIMLNLTSGSTGISKMVVVPSQITMRGMKILTILSTKSKSGCINFHSITWAMGMPYYFLATGQKRVLIDQRNPPFDEEFYQFVYDIIVQEKCDFSVMAASHLLRLVEIEKSRPGWPLKMCFVGGYPLSKHNVDRIMPYMDTMYNCYGLTETYMISFKKIEKTTEYEDFNSGTPLPNTQVKIVDENNQPVQDGETGSILIKSQHMFSRYLNDESATESAFTEDGFFKTGDAGYFNIHGELITYGRVSEVIMRGFAYFHPSWIQNIIKTCPGIDNVLVVKVPDENLYNEICACVVLEPNSNLDKDLIMKFCLQKFVTNNPLHKSPCPKYIIIMDKLPLNSNGKPDRLATEKYAAKFLNL